MSLLVATTLLICFRCLLHRTTDYIRRLTDARPRRIFPAHDYDDESGDDDDGEAEEYGDDDDDTDQYDDDEQEDEERRRRGQGERPGESGEEGREADDDGQSPSARRHAKRKARARQKRLDERARQATTRRAVID